MHSSQIWSKKIDGRVQFVHIIIALKWPNFDFSPLSFVLLIALVLV